MLVDPLMHLLFISNFAIKEDSKFSGVMLVKISFEGKLEGFGDHARIGMDALET